MVVPKHLPYSLAVAGEFTLVVINFFLQVWWNLLLSIVCSYQFAISSDVHRDDLRFIWCFDDGDACIGDAGVAAVDVAFLDYLAQPDFFNHFFDTFRALNLAVVGVVRVRHCWLPPFL